MTCIRSRLRQPELWRCGLALIVAGSAATAKAQCAAGGGGGGTTAAPATGTSATAFGGGAGLTTLNASTFRPTFGTPQVIQGNALQASFFSQQAALQARSAANQQALARKLALMRQQSMAKRQAQADSGELSAATLPRKTQPSEAQREASRRYWTTIAGLQPKLD
jgi:hypothetical protein